MNLTNARRHVQAFDFRRLFLEELGWDRLAESLRVEVDAEAFVLQGVAHKRGMVVLWYASPGAMPPHALRRRIERQVARVHYEHLILFTDGARREQIWQWVRREPGKPLASREFRYFVGQSGEPLLQKLEAISVTLDEEADLTLTEIVGRVRAALDVERVTKKFYDQFKRERDAFEGFLRGIPDAGMARWYVSVMLNRLMFIYFIEKKGFLSGDIDYLRTRLFESRFRGADRYYRDVLCPLFFQGFALPKDQRPPEVRELLGDVPYLNGGIFQRHEVEELCGQAIDVPDAAFERLFGFFEQYQWHLDDRPLRKDNEINPDVLGYIFEKYINQKQMGAYYTKEDITGYISRNSILPFLFDEARRHCRPAFEGEGSLWHLLREDPDRYVYPAVRHGAALPLPPEIEAGIADVRRRGGWNRPAEEGHALPTEIWRETVARRQRYEEVRGRLAAGEVHEINDLITYNLDIQQFAQDVIETCDDPDLLRAFWKAIRGVSCLDPTSGSGAFLFAALNVLEPLYEACLDRMQVFLDELDSGASPKKYADFREVLAQVQRHPNRKYYVYKSIIVDNLYGVDIMAEATEIAKLRLFLKLVAQVESADRIEPLPDIDFNIRTGNTLVGFATREQVQEALCRQDVGGGKVQDRLPFPEEMARLRSIEERAEDVDRLYRRFRDMQISHDLNNHGQDLAEAKAELRRRLGLLEDELDRALAVQYGVDPNRLTAYRQWLDSHQPFHWFVEFYGIVRSGGFDVILGNPPYLEQSQIDYNAVSLETSASGAVHAMCIERSTQLLQHRGCVSMIVPLALVSTQRMTSVQRLLEDRGAVWYASFSWRPGKLFETVNRALTIFTLVSANHRQCFSTTYQKWNADTRSYLMLTLRFTRAPSVRPSFWVPKLGETIESSLLQKCLRQVRQLGHFILPRGGAVARVYYRTDGGLYWKVFTDFPPFFRIEGRPDHSSRETSFAVQQEEWVRSVIALLSSNTFWWWYTVTSNCRHLNPSDIAEFPVPESLLRDLRLAELAAEYLSDMERHSSVLVREQRQTGRTETQTFKISKSKPIVDRIDQNLQMHYGFTELELDFIINYDIKYRMGDELQGGADEEE